jgi:hypothetical protein
MKRRKPPKKLYIIIRYEDKRGELTTSPKHSARAIVEDPVVILEKREALSYAEHYGATLVEVPWKALDGQYGPGDVLRSRGKART